ncbi:rhomboid family intramembrane serine protease [Arenibacter sp. GZD96]|uniref:rhomboid family intramembrane serine protease n=1 Tax=Aurantibrevibacter litoralis TaxID=3106030 RepID=UPI002AFE2568|nr:rhomboid family intramembrane serine protease [Arenibacter sp. GZD-96]MEA1785901.1 rhomboid family intramembrane serine protease [Arenibacter sp. GZD-96]
MEQEPYFKFDNSVIGLPLLFALVLWFVYWVEVRFGFNFTSLGVLPRTFSGLIGIVLSPFIHGSVSHLYNNTLPLILLTAALFYFYRNSAWQVLLIGMLMSGGITWGIGRPSYHIGASGIIYVLVSFIFFKGIFTKYYRLIALSLIIVFIYGSLVWYIFPVEDGISWEGHLGGFLTGLLLAVLIKTKTPSPKKYFWEQEDYSEENDEFMQHFDEDGNFIESPQEPPTEETQVLGEDKKIKIRYYYKRNTKEDED